MIDNQEQIDGSPGQSQVDDREQIIALMTQPGPQRERIFQAIRVRFTQIARYRNIPKADVDDIVNSGLEKVLVNIEKFHGRGTFSAWTGVVFSNLCMDYHRRRDFVDTDVDLDLPDGAPGLDESLAQRSLVEAVQRAVEQVIQQRGKRKRNAERNEKIARLAMQELMEPKEIFDILQPDYPSLTLNAVRLVLFEYRSHVRAILGETLEDHKDGDDV